MYFNPRTPAARAAYRATPSDAPPKSSAPLPPAIARTGRLANGMPVAQADDIQKQNAKLVKMLYICAGIFMFSELLIIILDLAILALEKHKK